MMTNCHGVVAKSVSELAMEIGKEVEDLFPTSNLHTLDVTASGQKGRPILLQRCLAAALQATSPKSKMKGLTNKHIVEPAANIMFSIAHVQSQ